MQRIGPAWKNDWLTVPPADVHTDTALHGHGTSSHMAFLSTVILAPGTHNAGRSRTSGDVHIMFHADHQHRLYRLSLAPSLRCHTTGPMLENPHTLPHPGFHNLASLWPFKTAERLMHLSGQAAFRVSLGYHNHVYNPWDPRGCLSSPPSTVASA